MRIEEGPAGLRLEGFAVSDREVSLRARVRSALRAGGFEVPDGVLATLDPRLGRRALPASLGLPLAAGIRGARGQIPADGIGMRVWSGELAPDGGVRLASPAAVSQLGGLRPGGLAGVRRDPAEGVWPLLGDADGKVVGLMDVGFVDDPESPSSRTRLFSQLG